MVFRFFAAKPSPVAGVLPKQPAYPLCLQGQCFHCGEHRLSQPIHAVNLTGPRGQAREPTRGPRASRNRVQTWIACRWIGPPTNAGARYFLPIVDQYTGVKLKSVSEDLLLSAERDDVRMTLLFLY
jgi:hypothetical protein